MNDKEYERYRLILDLGGGFLEDFKVSMEAFSDEEQVEISGVLVEIAEKLEAKEDYKGVYKDHIEPILFKYKNKCLELSRRHLTDYFVQDSDKLFDLMHKKCIDDPKNQLLTDDEYARFMIQVKNLMSNHRHFTLLRMPVDSEIVKSNLTVGESDDLNVTKNKDHTARRRALFLHYLDKQFRISADRKPLAEIGSFLTGNSEDNLYKYLRNPLNMVPGEKRALSEESLKKDLRYVKRMFERLDIPDIITMIDKDINSF